MLELKKLLESLDKIKEDKLPEFKEHIANKLLNEHELNIYAVLQTSFVLYASSLSDKQQRLYQFYFPALSGELKSAEVIQQAQQLTQEQVTQSIQLLEEKALIHHFLVDVLVFARLNGELSNDFKQVLNAFCHGQSLKDAEINEIIYITDCILGIIEKEKPEITQTTLDLLENMIWLEFIGKRVTVDNIDKLQGGIWYIDQDFNHLEENLIWKDTIVAFIENYSLKQHNGSLTIENSHIICPIIVTQGTAITFDNMKVSGNYAVDKKQTAFTISLLASPKINNCSFQTIGARTIEFNDSLEIQMHIKNCSFVNCGNESLVGGAISFKNKLYVRNCHFENCKARIAGAIFGNILESDGILSSKFINCSSIDKIDGKYSYGAIYFHTMSSEKNIINSYIDGDITIGVLNSIDYETNSLISNTVLNGMVNYGQCQHDNTKYGYSLDLASRKLIGVDAGYSRNIKCNVGTYEDLKKLG